MKHYQYETGVCYKVIKIEESKEKSQLFTAMPTTPGVNETGETSTFHLTIALFKRIQFKNK